jgi:uncharacterized membrane protein
MALWADMHIDPLIIFFRWLHVFTACVVIGAVLFMRLILPAGLRNVDAETADGVFLRCRRALKFVVHAGILFFLISGIYNAISNWNWYKQWPAAQGAFHVHLLCAGIALVILIFFFARAKPFASYKAWMMGCLIVLALAVAAGATLKSAREAVMENSMNTLPTARP